MSMRIFFGLLMLLIAVPVSAHSGHSEWVDALPATLHGFYAHGGWIVVGLPLVVAVLKRPRAGKQKRGKR